MLNFGASFNKKNKRYVLAILGINMGHANSEMTYFKS